MKQPEVKLNPEPRMRYEITVKVDGAPGQFDRIDGHVDYRSEMAAQHHATQQGQVAQQAQQSQQQQQR